MMRWSARAGENLVKLALVGMTVGMASASAALASDVDYRLNTGADSWTVDSSVDAGLAELSYSIVAPLPGPDSTGLDGTVTKDGSHTGGTDAGMASGGPDGGAPGGRDGVAVTAPLPTSGLLGLGGLAGLAGLRRRRLS